jgi:endonuclease/exonuclease/phosphatase family metal-dependent hydrolase
MMQHRLVVVALLLTALAPRLAHAASPQRLRIVTYNIHHGEGVDGRLDLERIAAVIRSTEPDLVALQEVDQVVERTGRVDQPAELARLTDMHVIFGKNIDLEGGGYGNAVLSKQPAKQIENLPLPALINDSGVDDREQRGALVVEVPADVGGPLVFIATHLDHRRPDAERLESARVINAVVADRFADRSAILAGDLNAPPTSDVLARFSEAWRNPSDELPTTPVKTPRRQIDFILVRPAERWQIVEARVLDERVASDHRPLLVVLELAPQAP